MAVDTTYSHSFHGAPLEALGLRDMAAFTLCLDTELVLFVRVMADHTVERLVGACQQLVILLVMTDKPAFCRYLLFRTPDMALSACRGGTVNGNL